MAVQIDENAICLMRHDADEVLQLHKWNCNFSNCKMYYGIISNQSMKSSTLGSNADTCGSSGGTFVLEDTPFQEFNRCQSSK